MRMCANIEISEETKAELARVKRHDETWDEFLCRLAEEHAPVRVGSWSDDEAVRAREGIQRSRKSFER